MPYKIGFLEKRTKMIPSKEMFSLSGLILNVLQKSCLNTKSFIQVGQHELEGKSV